ncbi:MAG: hypothetical protein C4B58_10110 [Deltaproteobacteria bacterium]|nr:MAG: hypothetical protein C4B58_10110 [Deltaproteobacteria bacterium]
MNYALLSLIKLAQATTRPTNKNSKISIKNGILHLIPKVVYTFFKKNNLTQRRKVLSAISDQNQFNCYVYTVWQYLRLPKFFFISFFVPLREFLQKCKLINEGCLKN